MGTITPERIQAVSHLQGVPAAQFESATSRGATGASALASKMWCERSVEVNP